MSRAGEQRALVDLQSSREGARVGTKATAEYAAKRVSRGSCGFADSRVQALRGPWCCAASAIDLCAVWEGRGRVS